MRRRPPPGTPLGALVQRVLAPAVNRHGFATSELIARWADIVGSRFASVTRPMRVVWPRMPAEAPESAARAPATLVVRCLGAHALDLQHAAPLIIERVNALYGWRAIEKLTIRQGPVEEVERTPAFVIPPAPAHVTAPLATIEDEALREALAKLGGAVAARRVTKP